MEPLRKAGLILNIITSVIVISLYWIFLENSNFTTSKIRILSFSILLYSIAGLLPKNDILCPYQAFLINSFQLAEYICSLMLCFSTFISIVLKKHLEKYKITYRIIFTIIVFGIPIVCSVFLITTNAYGNSGGYCWIDLENRYKRDLIRKVLLYLIVCMQFLLSLILFFIIKTFVIIFKTSNYYINKNLYKHIMIYPIIMEASALPGMILRIYMATHKLKNLKVLNIFTIIFENYCGCFINICYIFSPWIKQSMYNIFETRNSDKEKYEHGLNEIGSIKPILFDDKEDLDKNSNREDEEYEGEEYEEGEDDEEEDEMEN